MTPRRWQVVSGVLAVALVIAALIARKKHHGVVAPPKVTQKQIDAGVPRPDGAPPLYDLKGAVIDARGNRVVGALVTVLAAHSEAALAAGARAVWRQQGELGVYSGPLPSARVAAKMPSAVAWSGKTDGQGAFVLTGILGGHALVVAEHPSAGRGEVEVEVGKPNDLVVRLEPLPPQPDGGAPEAGTTPPPVPVVVRDARTRAVITGARVTFSEGKVHVRAGRYAPADVDLPADAREIEVDLELAASISGRVLDDRGDPVAGAEVQAGGASARSDARGEFRLAGVKPGDLTVAAQSAGREGSTQLRVDPGDQRHDVDIRLR
jgi:hypothetical protein